jgi:hypothetical protein
MRAWKMAATLVCGCIFVLGEASEAVRLAHFCWIHQGLCREEIAAPLHSTGSTTLISSSS